jgi:hypothetical protein
MEHDTLEPEVTHQREVLYAPHICLYDSHNGKSSEIRAVAVIGYMCDVCGRRFEGSNSHQAMTLHIKRKDHQTAEKS